jgi:predicted component of viral defense system (DUF524 family)
LSRIEKFKVSADLKREIYKVNIALTTMKKETKESNYNHEKVIKTLEDSIKDLIAFKMTKIAEERALKKKQKKAERKQRSIDKLKTKRTTPEQVLGELEVYKTALEVGMREDKNIDPYGPPEGCSGYYWGGEDSCEMIFYD